MPRNHDHFNVSIFFIPNTPFMTSLSSFFLLISINIPGITIYFSILRSITGLHASKCIFHLLVVVTPCNDNPFCKADQVKCDTLTNPKTGKTPSMKRQVDSQR